MRVYVSCTSYYRRLACRRKQHKQKRAPAQRILAASPAAAASRTSAHSSHNQTIPPPSLPYKVDTSRPSLRTNSTRLVHPSVLTDTSQPSRARRASTHRAPLPASPRRPLWGLPRGALPRGLLRVQPLVQLRAQSRAARQQPPSLPLGPHREPSTRQPPPAHPGPCAWYERVVSGATRCPAEALCMMMRVCARGTDSERYRVPPAGAYSRRRRGVGRGSWRRFLGGGLRDETCPISTGWGTRRVHLVRGEGGGGGAPPVGRRRLRRGPRPSRRTSQSPWARGGRCSRARPPPPRPPRSAPSPVPPRGACEPHAARLAVPQFHVQNPLTRERKMMMY